MCSRRWASRLRAEIDVTEITPAEADGLKVNIAGPTPSMPPASPYNAALADVRTSLQRRADGRYVVRLTSNRPLSEPFIDLLLEANWNSGRIVRDYTVLLDPPSEPHRHGGRADRAHRPANQRRASSRAAAPAVAQAPAAPRACAGRCGCPGSPGGEPNAACARDRDRAASKQVTVQPGDTASKIAGAYKPADVSLDQMLVALLRANPDAFIGGNVNRIKAGAVLDVPERVAGRSRPERARPRRTVTAQSRDFGEYRRRLAENAPASQVADADRQATGKLQANVEDRNAANAAADKLTRPQGASRAGQTEEQIGSKRARPRKAARASPNCRRTSTN